MGKGSKPTIGFWYAMTLQSGLCQGPVDALLELRAGDRTAWSGNQTTSGSVAINAPNLFGGEKKEGGLQGQLNVMMGEATQAPNAKLVTLRGSPQPAYRGLLTTVYDGLVAAMNPYIKPWSWKVRGLTAGWLTPVWEPALCGIDCGECMGINAAHFIYRLWVEDMGWDPSNDIDLVRHKAAAQTLYNEGMGLSIKWSRSDGYDRFIANICNHVGGMISEDPATGKKFLKLLRDDYDPATLPVLDKSNILEFKDYQQPTVKGSINQVTATYQRVKTNKKGSATAHNEANQLAQGAVVGKSVDYSLFPTFALAARAAQRDCDSQSALLATGTVRIQRSDTPIKKGDVMAFTFDFGQWSVIGMPVRILEVDEGTPTDRSVTLKFAQDQFGLPATSYIADPGDGWTEPVLDPQALTDQVLLEASYRDLATFLSNADLAALDVDSGYVAAVGARVQSVAYDYTLMTKLSGASAYAEVGSGDFAPSGTLQAAMAAEAGPTAVVLDGATNLDQVDVGTEALVTDGAGTLELCRVDAIDATAGTATLARGCVDTVPESFAAGARVYFTDHYTGVDKTEYVTGETVDAKLLPRTGLGELDMALATAISTTLDQRQARPYPPGKLTINGAGYPASSFGAMSVAWAHRDRVLQGDQLVDTTQAGIGPEAGTTYTVRVYLDGALDAIYPGLTGASTTLSVLSGDGLARVEVQAINNGLTSWQNTVAEFTYTRTEPRITASGTTRITESGATRTVET